MTAIEIDTDYLLRTLAALVAEPSPVGMTDAVVDLTARELDTMGVPVELTRRGAIRASLGGRRHAPERAIVAHLDTLGAMVAGIEDDGRLRVASVGHWSSRFAEGGRVTVFGRDRRLRGTVLPEKASGHAFGTEVDTQPVSWQHLRLRLDADVRSAADAERLGVAVGDYAAFDPRYEVTDTGYVNSRHLDDKAGVAAVLAAVRAVRQQDVTLAVDCHLLFTISEEVGSGASHVLHQDVAELVSVDNAVLARGQGSSERGVTLAMLDLSGPFDLHLTRKLVDLCETHGIAFARDVFRHYRSDAAAAVEAGSDIRTALVGFGVDGSHGYERVHVDSLVAVARLLAHYMRSGPTFERDRRRLTRYDADAPTS